MNKSKFSEHISEYENEYFDSEHFDNNTITDIYFDACTFKNCQFTNSELSTCQFLNCDFINCDLSLVKISNSVFNKTKFDNCNLIGIDWTLAKWMKNHRKNREVATMNFVACKLDFSIFMDLDISKSIFDTCSMKDVILDNTISNECKFNNCDFQNATFKDADLRKSDFTTACNYNIDVRNNNVKGAKFDLPEALNLLYCLDIDLGK